MVVLARAQAAVRDGESAAELGVRVLETVPVGGLRETTKSRLRHLLADVDGYQEAVGLREAAQERL